MQAIKIDFNVCLNLDYVVKMCLTAQMETHPVLSESRCIQLIAVLRCSSVCIDVVSYEGL